jgi:hypothetical protein
VASAASHTAAAEAAASTAAATSAAATAAASASAGAAGPCRRRWQPLLLLLLLLVKEVSDGGNGLGDVWCIGFVFVFVIAWFAWRWLRGGGDEVPGAEEGAALS